MLPFLTPLQYLQKPHHHPHCLRRGSVVRRQRDRPHPRFLFPHGWIVHHRRLVRYLLNPRQSLRWHRRCRPYIWRRRPSARRHSRRLQPWLRLDVCQLHRFGRICEWDITSICRELTRCQVLCMRKRIKVTGFKDWDSMFYNNLLSIPVLFVFSILVEDWSGASFARNL